MMSKTAIGQTAVEELAEALEEVEPKSTPSKRYEKAQRWVNTMSMNDAFEILLNAGIEVFSRAVEGEFERKQKRTARVTAAVSTGNWSRVCQVAAN